jgi:predicted Holliday junction resolvase-like endonuclease
MNDQIETMETEYDTRVETMEDEHGRALEDLEAAWRERVDLEVERHLEKKKREIRAQAIAGSRVTTLGKTIERIAPMFSGFGHEFPRLRRGLAGSESFCPHYRIR